MDDTLADMGLVMNEGKTVQFDSLGSMAEFIPMSMEEIWKLREKIKEMEKERVVIFDLRNEINELKDERSRLEHNFNVVRELVTEKNRHISQLEDKLTDASKLLGDKEREFNIFKREFHCDGICLRKAGDLCAYHEAVHKHEMEQIDDPSQHPYYYIGVKNDQDLFMCNGCRYFEIKPKVKKK